ncbi:uncharacterized protein TNCV_1769971 [Trichonephila clavipes]|nr:uncharacterized protein TNCV_1769971 [Trichonephila clavipes]
MTREMVKREGYKRSHESRSGGPERKFQKGSEHRVPIRALSSNYRINHSLTKFRKKSRREETVTPTTSGYNLRPRIGKREVSRPTTERKTQQGRPVRYRKGRERNDSPYIEERTRSSDKNARRGGDQQRQDQERRGTCTKKSLSLEVLVGNANYTNKETTKVRMIFDASSKSRDCKSMNECLYAGPPLSPRIIDVFLRFREYEHAFCSDIQRAFLTIGIAEEEIMTTSDIFGFRMMEMPNLTK